MPSSTNSSALSPKTSTSQNDIALSRVSALKASCENQPRYSPPTTAASTPDTWSSSAMM